MLKAVVVAGGGEDGAVGGQRDGGQRIAVCDETDEELARDVLGVARAAAVAGDEQRAAGAHAGGNGVGHGVEQGGGFGVRSEGAQDGDRFVEKGGRIVQRARH